MSIHSAARANPWLAWLWLLLLTGAAFAQDAVPVPALSSPVTDLTQTLTAEQRTALESRLRAYEAEKGTQIAVLIVPTTQPETIEQYSIRVADQWKIGRQGVDDGVILLVAKNDRAVRIEVGTGLEGALPDVLASRIISQVIVPRFREGDFAGGINEAITRIIALLEGEALPEPERRSSSERSRDSSGNWLPVLLMFVFVGSGILRGIFGRVGGAFATGSIAGVLMWLLTWTLGLTILGAVIAFVVALLTGGGGGGFGGGGPGGWTGRRRGGGFSDGLILGGGLGGLGGGGGRSSGGFGGGGFGGGWSGGGGGFSGGGASGRW